jgi:hypothetical protein
MGSAPERYLGQSPLSTGTFALDGAGLGAAGSSPWQGTALDPDLFSGRQLDGMSDSFPGSTGAGFEPSGFGFPAGWLGGK